MQIKISTKTFNIEDETMAENVTELLKPYSFPEDGKWAYDDAIIANALELYIAFESENHSGYSAAATLELFNSWER
jgi:hypothetical protein